MSVIPELPECGPGVSLFCRFIRLRRRVRVDRCVLNIRWMFLV